MDARWNGLVSVETDPKFQNAVKPNLGEDTRVTFHVRDGAAFLENATDRLVRACRRALLLLGHQMAQTVEISLRIPSLRVRREGKEATETIANSDVRFGKRIELKAIPKPGDILTMTVSSGGTFECDVVRSDWQHDKGMFLITCRYSKRSISPAEYQALVDASDWQVRSLL